MANEGKSRVIISAASPLGGHEDVKTDGSGRLQTTEGTSQYHGKTLVDVVMDAQASGDLVAAQGAGNKIKVVSFFGTISLDGTLKFTRGVGGTSITGAMTLKAGGGFFAIPASPEVPLFETGANEKLSVVLSGGTFSGLLRYYVET